MNVEGTPTTATLERIAVTGHTRYDHKTGLSPTQVWITFRYVARDGSEMLREQDHWLLGGWIPPVGSRAAIVYHPGGAIEFSHADVEPPDPNVPAGWSAGMFDVPSLGAHRELPEEVAAGLKAERELFATGLRGRAMVRAIDEGWMSDHQANKVTLTLRTDAQEFTVQRWLASAYLPSVGDVIEIAMSPDGTRISLDTDERYTGGKGRALVFRTPPAEQSRREDLARRARAPATNDLIGQLDQQLAQFKQARAPMGKRYEQTIRTILDGYLRAGTLDQAGYQQRLTQALTD